MSLNGQELFFRFSEFADDFWSGTTNSAGLASGLSIVDTALNKFGEDGLVGGWIRIREGAAINEVRRVTAFTGGTVTPDSAFSVQIGSGIDYEFHRYEPRKKFAALDRARIVAFPQLAILRIDETITADGDNYELTIPSTMRKGPMAVFAESDLGATPDWQLLTNGALTATTGWDASGVTATVVTRRDWDRLVPRKETSCVMLVGSGTFRQTVANMRSGFTAATAAGREVTFGVWVYSRTAGPTVSVLHDGSPGTSSAHLGLGWQFLTVTLEVTTLNTSVLTVSINTTGNYTVYVERAFFGLLPSIPITYPHYVGRQGIRRDDSAAKVALDRRVERGTQLRMEGRAPLSALGTDVATQLTNTMEIDELNADLLYATAARILFTWEGWTTDNIETFPKIQTAAARFTEQEETSRIKYPHTGRLTV